jgi:hypothetical protein
MVEKKYRFAILSKFEKKLKELGKDFKINKYAEQWAADALLESYGSDTCYEMIDYYFYVAETPDWKWFINHADKIYKNLTARKEDDRIRSLMREQAKGWLSK